MPCPLAYVGKPCIQLPGTLAFTEEWLHTAGVGTQGPHSDQATLLILLMMTARVTGPVYQGSTVFSGTEQAVSRHYL